MKTLVFVFILISSFSFLVSSPPSVYAQSDWSGRCVANGDVATIQGLECLFFNILQVITVIAGLAFIVMFLYGSFQYLYSSNNEKSVAAASATLTMAIAGLVGIIVSWLILKFIQEFTGVNVTDFIIPG